MLTVSDFIPLSYDPGLSEAGSAYACRWLAGVSGPAGEVTAQRLRRCAGGAAVELAFRRYLDAQELPFETRQRTPFSRPEHYVVTLGGHRCELIGCLLSRPNQVRELEREPASLLQAGAQVPLDRFTAEGQSPDDLYVFAFLVGSVAATQADIRAALAGGQPVRLVHVLPEAWRRPAAWQPLEPLALKSECTETIPLELGGLDAQRDFIAESLELAAHRRVLVKQEYYSLAYLQTRRLPEARLGVHSPPRGPACIIRPHEWADIWIEGRQVLLAGWLTQAEFRSKASLLKAGSAAIQFSRTQPRNLQVPLRELKPLGSLLEKVRAWEINK